MENEYKIQFRAYNLFWLDFNTIPDRFSLIEVQEKLKYLRELCSSNGIVEYQAVHIPKDDLTSPCIVVGN